MNIIILKKCEHGKAGERVFVPLFEGLKLCKSGDAREVNAGDMHTIDNVNVTEARKSLGWKPLDIAQASLV